MPEYSLHMVIMIFAKANNVSVFSDVVGTAVREQAVVIKVENLVILGEEHHVGQQG